MITAKWIDGGREPQAKPNPRFPDGVDLDLTHGSARHCKVKLPYPAKRCGYYALLCTRCRMSAVVTTAGRPDDPRSVMLPCKRKNGAAA
jgi:hypothetical protein